MSSKSKTVFHLSNNYAYNKGDTLSITYYSTQKSHVTVELDEERTAVAHRFLVNLCEEQLREDTPLPAAAVKRISAPSTLQAANDNEKAKAKDVTFEEDIPL